LNGYNFTPKRLGRRTRDAGDGGILFIWVLYCTEKRKGKEVEWWVCGKLGGGGGLRVGLRVGLEDLGEVWIRVYTVEYLYVMNVEGTSIDIVND